MKLNHYLDTVRMKVLQIHRELEQDGKPITADVLKDVITGGRLSEDAAGGFPGT